MGDFITEGISISNSVKLIKLGPFLLRNLQSNTERNN